MPSSILPISLNKAHDQKPYINAINSGQYTGVSFVLHANDVSEELLQALEDTYLSIELPLVYNSTRNTTTPAFPYTKIITRLSKRRKKSRLNIKRCSFSFSKYNVTDFIELSKWTTPKELILKYFVRQGETKVNNTQQRKYSDIRFFRNMADLIAHNKSLTDLQLNIYTFYSEFSGNIEHCPEDLARLGMAHYFPYSDYSSVHPPKSSVALDDQTLMHLLKAFVTNYSLVNINIDEWVSGVFNRVSSDILLDLQSGILYNFLQKSLQEFELEVGNISGTEIFLQAIHRRNQIAAEQMLNAAKEGNTKRVEQLLNKGVSVHTTDAFGNTPLHLAAKNGFADIVKLLRNKQADWRVPNNDGQTPIHLVQQEDRWQIVAMLLNQKYEVKPIITVPVKERKTINTLAPIGEKTTVTPKVAVVGTSRNVAGEQSLYPKITPINSSVASEVQKSSTASKKGCPFSNIMKFFRPAEGAAKSSFNAIAAKNNTDAVKLDKMPSTTLTPPQDPKQIAREIADTAITVAINGLDATPSCYPANATYGAYSIIEGIFNEATFDGNSRKKLIDFIQGILMASRLSLGNLNVIQKECLIRHLAMNMKNTILVFKDSSDCDIELTINRKMKDKDKRELLNDAIHDAFKDADERLRLSSIPSAPPLMAEDLLDDPVNKQLPPLTTSGAIYNQNYMTSAVSLY